GAGEFSHIPNNPKIDGAALAISPTAPSASLPLDFLSLPPPPPISSTVNGCGGAGSFGVCSVAVFAAPDASADCSCAKKPPLDNNSDRKTRPKSSRDGVLKA